MEKKTKRFEGNDKLYNRNFADNVSGSGSGSGGGGGNGGNGGNDDVARLDLERSFGKSSAHDDNSSSGSKVGEITGGKLRGSAEDRGMPMRSQYQIKKELYDGNKYLDFDLHEKAASKKKTKIGYNESGSYTPFAEVGATTVNMTQQIDPLYIVSGGIEKFGSDIFEYLIDQLSNNGFIVGAIGLYTLFGSLYLAADNVTLNELEKFFKFPPKGACKDGMRQMMRAMGNTVVMKNLIVVANDIPHNAEFRQSIGDLCVYLPVDNQDEQGESQKLNYIINQMMGTQMRSAVGPSHLENLQMMFMTVGVVHPRWHHPFDKVIVEMFTGYDAPRRMNFLLSINKPYHYYEDNDHQLIELACGKKRELIFGILLHKTTFTPETNEKLQFYISHAKNTILEEVRIPMFTQDSKIRYNATLKNLGLNSVFYQVTAEELFPKKVQLHDVIQNIKVIVDASSHGVPQPLAKGVTSMRKFIANQPFIYYLRISATNTIIMTGIYQ